MSFLLEKERRLLEQRKHDAEDAIESLRRDPNIPDSIKKMLGKTRE